MSLCFGIGFFQKLRTETSEMGLQEACIGAGLAIFHDEGYKESDVDVEIQLPLKTHFKDTENVVFKTVSEIEYASATYKGSYDQITEVCFPVKSK